MKTPGPAATRAADARFAGPLVSRFFIIAITTTNNTTTISFFGYFIGRCAVCRPLSIIVVILVTTANITTSSIIVVIVIIHIYHYLYHY